MTRLENALLAGAFFFAIKSRSRPVNKKGSLRTIATLSAEDSCADRQGRADADQN
ncbi:hypothetical protein [uncultured Stenotrophomonas sp.]|uniref:hypothetical protein n=1 Tax=uncultured Stenotrophomonas sp. TaxID=165438 RepID=UPI0025D86D27|nr:hypothetical protein [uncultured Stenotrophomonas sp.]